MPGRMIRCGLLAGLFGAVLGAPLAAAPQILSAAKPASELEPSKAAAVYARASLDATRSRTPHVGARSSSHDAADVSNVLARKSTLDKDLSRLQAAEQQVFARAERTTQQPVEVSLLDRALEQAEALEKQQQRLLQETSRIRKELSIPAAVKPRTELAARGAGLAARGTELAARGDVAPPPRAIAPANGAETLEVEILERQREALVDEVIRLRKKLRTNETRQTENIRDSALNDKERKLEELLGQERQKVASLQEELRTLQEKLQTADNPTAQEELRQSLAYHQERVEHLEQREQWLSQQLASLRRFARDRRAVTSKMMEQEKDYAELKLKLRAMEGIDDENERLRQALQHSKQQLEAVQEAAQTFIDEAAPEGASTQKVIKTIQEPKQAVQAAPRAAGRGQLSFR